MLWLIFGNAFINDAKLIELLGGAVIENLKMLFIAFAGVNAIIEAAVGLVFGTAICKALFVVEEKIF